MTDFSLRPLTIDSIDILREIFLRAVREEPLSFWRSPGEIEARTIDEWRESLPPHVPLMLGAFRGDRLVGISGLTTEGRAKKAHKLVLVAVYVEPESRGLKIGRALVESAIDFAFQGAGVRAVRLTVTDRDSAAVKLYRTLGFETWGREPESILVDGIPYNDLHMQLSRQRWNQIRAAKR